ncbi:MAG: hypothetical protein WEE89_08205 [Gemmatimonadota bacterium]
MAQVDSKVQALSPGSKVRLELPLTSVGRSVGTASEASATGFLFQPAKSSTSQQVQFSDLKSLEVSTGTNQHFGAGFLIGLVGGALGGYVSGSRSAMRDYGVAVFGVLGGLVGAIIGGQVKTDHWVTIPLH